MDEQTLREIEEEMPKPTIWPAALAAGLVSAAFGMLTVGIFFYVGVAVAVVSIAGWMRDLSWSQEPGARSREGSDSRLPTLDSGRTGGTA
jgi:hypothetical protein